MALAHRVRIGAGLAVAACAACSGSQSTSSMQGHRADFSEPLVDGGLGLRAAPGTVALASPDGGTGAPGGDALPAPAARTLAIDTLAESERVASLAVVEVQRGYVLASVTYADQGLPGQRASARNRSAPRAASPPPVGATVVVRALDDRGNLKKSPTVVSAKAESVGGVALASSPFDPGEVALAWVGRDAGLGQVFVTRIGSDGEKLGQRMLTRSKGGCSDVALAATKGGFIVAWLDQRDGRSAVYAAKVNRELERIGDEHKIAETKGEASEVRLASEPSQVVLAWSEARDEEGTSGIFAARLAGDDLSLRAESARILPASRMASSLQLLRFQNGLVFGWVETAGPARGVALAWVDASFRGLPQPKVLAVPIEASSLAIDCGDPRSSPSSTCRVVVSGAEQGQLSFYAFAYRPSETIEAATRLVVMAGPSTEDTSPVLIGGRLFFAEDNLRGGGRVRVAQLAWR